MIRLWMIPVLLAVVPMVALAQPVSSDIAYLRTKANAEGWVEVSVTPRGAAEVRALRAPSLTTDKQTIIGRAQQKIMMILVSRGLVVGNEVSLQPNGSLVLRVLPRGLDFLAASPDVAEVRANIDASKVAP